MKQNPQAVGEGCARIVSCDETKSRVLSLDSGVLSIGENGDKVRATRFYASSDESWRLERLRGAAETVPNREGSATARAEKVAELSKKDRKLGRRVEDLVKRDADIVRLKAELDAKDRGIRSRDQELMTKHQELARKEQELAMKDRELMTKHQELARKEQELAMKDRELLAKIQEIAELKTLRPRPSIIRRLLQEAELRSKGSRSSSRSSSTTPSIAPPVSVTYGSEFDFRSQDIDLRSQYSEEEEEVLDGEVANLYARAEKLETILSQNGDDSESGSHYEY
ncbi:hypothetical protein RSAG8_01955, partial [Rhizoctonia solani AG-8 WAC10335]